MNKQQLASKIWESANRMRSKIEANEYKDYILGFIFYKYLSDTEIKYVRSKGGTVEDVEALSEDDADTVTSIRKNLGYFISHKNLFSTWLSLGKDFNVSNVRDALSAFTRLISPTHEKVFGRILDTLNTGLSKLGDSTGTQTKSVSELIQLIKDIPMDGRQDYDVLGFIYEYLISMFAANAGKKAGEFYTPHEVSVLMSEIVADHLKDRSEIKIYDPTSGSGSLLINIGKSLAKHISSEDNIKYYSQELKENTYNLTRMNLVMRGILPDNIEARNGDTLAEDWPYFEDGDPAGTYVPLFVDAVVSNPPYSQSWDPAGKESDARFAPFGLAPKSKADYAFLLHDLYHLKPDGIMTIVLPHGVLFRGGEEGAIRRNLIERNHIDAVIGLPANIFFGTGIPTVIIVLKKTRPNSDVLVIDASKGFAKVGKNNVLRASDIRRIADTVIARADAEKFSRVVSREEIRQNEYNLNIPRYVDASADPEKWDLYSTMFGGIPKSEIAAFDAYWRTFTGLTETLFAKSDTRYTALATDDIEKTIGSADAVISWKRRFASAFEDFPGLLKSELIGKWDAINIGKEESVIADEMFRRLETVALVDRYSAYQALDDEWSKIAVDLEILQTEGFEAVKKVDPIMVTKKKEGKEEEVQEGWTGRVIPFELIQSAMLGDETSALRKKEQRLAEIQSALDEIIDSLPEEEIEKDDDSILNGTKDSFVASEVAKKVKELFCTPSKAKTAVLGYDEDSFERKVVQAQQLLDEEKELRKKVRDDSAALQLASKDAIENLSDLQVVSLLEMKWITPLTTALEKIPERIVADLVSGVKALSGKYATTYSEIIRDIAETKSDLSSVIDCLTADETDMKALKAFQAMIQGECDA